SDAGGDRRHRAHRRPLIAPFAAPARRSHGSLPSARASPPPTFATRPRAKRGSALGLDPRLAPPASTGLGVAARTLLTSAAMAAPYDGAVVVVTGASSGIGLELARQMAPRAKAIALVARREERLDALAKELRERYPSCRVLVHK